MAPYSLSLFLTHWSLHPLIGQESFLDWLRQEYLQFAPFDYTEFKPVAATSSKTSIKTPVKLHAPFIFCLAWVNAVCLHIWHLRKFHHFCDMKSRLLAVLNCNAHHINRLQMDMKRSVFRVRNAPPFTFIFNSYVNILSYNLRHYFAQKFWYTQNSEMRWESSCNKLQINIHLLPFKISFFVSTLTWLMAWVNFYLLNHKITLTFADVLNHE